MPIRVIFDQYSQPGFFSSPMTVSPSAHPQLSTTERTTFPLDGFGRKRSGKTRRQIRASSLRRAVARKP